MFKKATLVIFLVFPLIIGGCVTKEVKEAHERGLLLVACDRNFAPYTFQEEGLPSGLLVDLWSLWAESTGQAVKFEFSDWPGTITAVTSGQADAHSGLFYNEDRAKKMDFSLPLFRSSTSLFYPVSGSPVHRLEDLRGRRVGAISGSESENYLKRSQTGVKPIAFTDPATMVQAARAGEIAAFGDETLGMWTLLEAMGMEGDFLALPDELTGKDFHVAVKKGNQELLEKINTGFLRITPAQKARIRNKWVP